MTMLHRRRTLLALRLHVSCVYIACSSFSVASKRGKVSKHGHAFRDRCSSRYCMAVVDPECNCSARAQLESVIALEYIIHTHISCLSYGRLYVHQIRRVW